MVGEVIRVPFPYLQKKGYKNRPAIILAHNGSHLICAAVTSRRQNNRPEDVEINEWKEAGLLLPSRVRVNVITTFFINNMDIIKIGQLNEKDLQSVLTAFQKSWPATNPDEGGTQDGRISAAV